MNDQKPVYLITGANSGIGYATALELAKHQARVILVCRNQANGLTAQKQIKQTSNNPDIHLLIADLAVQGSLQTLIADVYSQFPDLNILINNAGAIFMRHRLTVDGLEQTFALNHMASFILTNGLLNILKANPPARIINVGSRAALAGSIRFDDLQGQDDYNRLGAYNQSKLANLLFTTELARRVKGSSISVNYFNPGNVDTHFGGILRNLKMDITRVFLPARYQAMKLIPVEQVAEALTYLALDPSINGISGQCFTGKEIDPELAKRDDPATAKRLWEASENLLKQPLS